MSYLSCINARRYHWWRRIIYIPLGTENVAWHVSETRSKNNKNLALQWKTRPFRRVLLHKWLHPSRHAYTGRLHDSYIYIRNQIIHRQFVSTATYPWWQKLKETIQVVLYNTRNIQGDSKRKWRDELKGIKGMKMDDNFFFFSNKNFHLNYYYYYPHIRYNLSDFNSFYLYYVLFRGSKICANFLNRVYLLLYERGGFLVHFHPSCIYLLHF